MKPPWEWVEDDILSLIRDGVKEAIDLDYKACFSLAKTDGKKNEVSKDVSAFANSAGGTLVYGVIENGHVPIRMDDAYDPADISKEWLEQVINSRIQRRIDGIRINQVELTKTAPGKVVYVVSVPQSNRAPHMASDHKFYKRFNFESSPMEEYEVRDVARRNEAPDLHLDLLFRTGISSALAFDEGAEYSKPIELNAILTNGAPTPAEYIKILVYVDTRVKIVNLGELCEASTHSLERSGAQVKQLYLNWSPAGHLPVWQGIECRISNQHLSIALPRVEGTGNYVLGYQLHSPRMPAKTTFGSLLSVSGQAIIVLREADSLTQGETQFLPQQS